MFFCFPAGDGMISRVFHIYASYASLQKKKKRCTWRDVKSYASTFNAMKIRRTFWVDDIGWKVKPRSPMNLVGRRRSWKQLQWWAFFARWSSRTNRQTRIENMCSVPWEHTQFIHVLLPVLQASKPSNRCMYTYIWSYLWSYLWSCLCFHVYVYIN